MSRPKGDENMVDTAITAIINTFNLIPFTGATWFLLAIIAFFVIVFVRANHDPNSSVSWEELIIDSDTKKTSPYKLGYLIGMIVATWVVVSLTDKEKLTLDIFGIYLTYLLGGTGWGLTKKTTPTTNPPPDVPPPVEENKTFAPPPG